MLFVSLIVYECLPRWISSNIVVFILKGLRITLFVVNYSLQHSSCRKVSLSRITKKHLFTTISSCKMDILPLPKPPAVAVNKTMSRRVAYYSLRITGQEFKDFCCLILSLTYSRLGSARLIQSSIWGSHRCLISPPCCSFSSSQLSSTASLLSCLWRFISRIGPFVM